MNKLQSPGLVLVDGTSTSHGLDDTGAQVMCLLPLIIATPNVTSGWTTTMRPNLVHMRANSGPISGAQSTIVAPRVQVVVLVHFSYDSIGILSSVGLSITL